MCGFGGSTYFADKINIWTAREVQSVVQISKKIKIFVQECMRQKRMNSHLQHTISENGNRNNTYENKI